MHRRIAGLYAYLERITHTMLADVLSTPTAVQFTHRFSILNNFTNLLSMLVKIVSAVELVVIHMSKK